MLGLLGFWFLCAARLLLFVAVDKLLFGKVGVDGTVGVTRLDFEPLIGAASSLSFNPRSTMNLSRTACLLFRFPRTSLAGGGLLCFQLPGAVVAV